MILFARQKNSSTFVKSIRHKTTKICKMTKDVFQEAKLSFHEYNSKYDSTLWQSKVSDSLMLECKISTLDNKLPLIIVEFFEDGNWLIFDQRIE